eukprot:CAMPEP_0119003292 /NCGR_PEP_ID=MMETSP1176-20130426/477_1 /TAXON_ID=265551 /ORGANISM="Synedropsis recta cf, Strain CCMP1620" /LENGTH=688 /DNA_ID=CAMNT_0006954881 /DNA_START=32 /DNA_END=2098 /DNA_ORIENTATION=-
MTTSKHFFTAFIAAILVQYGVAQKPYSPCLKTFRAIYEMEDALTSTDTQKHRTYTICPNTLIEPGVVEQTTGEINFDDLPLSCKENCHVRCGESGSSSNNCKIDGTGTYGVFQIPYFIFDDQPSSSENVVFEGFTLDFFINDKQYPVIIGAAFGDVSFIDWKFTNNNADPFFVMEETFYPGIAARSAIGERNTPLPGYRRTNSTNAKSGKTRRRTEVDEDNPLDIRTPEERHAQRRLSYADKRINSILSHEELEEEQRHLQSAAFQISFVDCLFDFNDPVREAETQFGLSVLRFSGSDISPLFMGEENSIQFVAAMDVRLIRNEFVDNIYFLSGDEATYRSMIDFHSTGRLVMRQNCFTRSPVKNFGVVTMTLGSVFVNTRNFLDSPQSDLQCQFGAFLNDDYEFQTCGSNAVAKSCRANVATSAPSAAPVGGGGGGFGGLCFPGDAHFQVEGRGQVLTKNLSLGDKVLVGGAKYEPIYSFGHRAEDSQVEYLKLVTAGRSGVELSRAHMVYVQGGRAVPASTIKIGDQVELADGEYATVKEIQVTQKQGAYAPFTASGSVVVNGVKASSFVAFQESEALTIGDIDTGLTFQFLAHTFEMPHRVWCQYFSSCLEEQYSAEGISTWVAIPFKLFRWFHGQSTVVMAALMLPISIMFVILANPVSSVVTLIVAIIGATTSFRPTMRIKSV